MKTSTQSRRAGVRPRRILVPVDFSDSSTRALRHAANRAAESGGSLIIIYVVPADYGWFGFGRSELRDLDRSLQRQAAERLRAFAEENVCENVPADMEVRVGQPAEEIVAAARESKCDSIMLSTRGLTGLDRYLIGSVADRVARLAPARSFSYAQASVRAIENKSSQLCCDLNTKARRFPEPREKCRSQVQ